MNPRLDEKIESAGLMHVIHILDFLLVMTFTQFLINDHHSLLKYVLSFTEAQNFHSWFTCHCYGEIWIYKIEDL